MGYGAGSAGKVTLIMGVDPLLDPANGPNWFPFDDEILYELKIDNDHDAREDVTLQFRFETDQRLPVAVPGVRRRGQRLRRAARTRRRRSRPARRSCRPASPASTPPGSGSASATP